MPDIQNLSSKTIKPLALLNKTNEISVTIKCNVTPNAISSKGIAMGFTV